LLRGIRQNTFFLFLHFSLAFIGFKTTL